MRFVLLISIASIAFAVPQRTPRIVGGTPTTIDQHPFLSNVQHLFRGFFWSQWCGGSLITTRNVLSAANCYYDMPNVSLWRIRLGTSFASSGGTVHAVAELVLHEEYDHNTFENDVAIVRLATPAVLSDTVARARIAGPNFSVPDGTRVTAIGWGGLMYNGGHPEQLQHVHMNIINHELCAQRYFYLKEAPGFEDWPVVTDGMVCAGILNLGGKGTCSGDDGGPVFVNQDIIYGITSWGYECANGVLPGVYTLVPYYSDWIVATANAS